MTCLHLQCFDASLYLQMNERKPTWNCPVCDKPAIYESLVIDEYVGITAMELLKYLWIFKNWAFLWFCFVDSSYFQKVLQSSRLPADINEIQLLNDGSWTAHDNNTDVSSVDTPRKVTQKVEVISDDIGNMIKSNIENLTNSCNMHNVQHIIIFFFLISNTNRSNYRGRLAENKY